MQISTFTVMLHCLTTGRYRFDFILEQVKAYESKLQQQQTQLEDTTEQFDEAKQECSRLSSENGNLESIFFYHFHHSNVFENELMDHINAMFVS